MLKVFSWCLYIVIKCISLGAHQNGQTASNSVSQQAANSLSLASLGSQLANSMPQLLSAGAGGQILAVGPQVCFIH